MCGYAFLLSESNSLTHKMYTKLLDRVNYRGEDERNMIIKEGHSMYHSRLSLIDIHQGSQPMLGNGVAKNLTIVFNGEIYNYKELKQLLQPCYNFKTESDTEVLLAAFAVWGPNALSELNGMYSFVIYDEKTKFVFAARDPSGQKPLYYSYRDQDILVSTCPFPIHGFCELSGTGLSQFLSLGYVTHPNSIYDNVYHLKPGQYLIFRDGEMKTEHFFRPEDIAIEENLSRYTFCEQVKHLDWLLHNSCERTLIAESSVGLLLSGGIDSSLLYSYVMNHHNFMKCFTLDTHDASSEINQVRKYCNEDRLENVCAEQLDSKLFQYVYGTVMDEPFSDSSAVYTSVLLKEAGKSVKCVITGDGADELFCGYPDRLAHTKKGSRVTTERWRRKISQAINKIQNRTFPVPFDASYRYPLYSTAEQHSLIGNTTSTISAKRKQSILYGLDEIDQVVLSDIADYLPSDINRKSDCIGLHYGVEVRSPFQDIQIIDFALSIPNQDKFTYDEYKTHLKALHKRKYSQIVSLKKQGFGLDVTKYLRRDDMIQLYNYYTSPNSKISQHIDVNIIRKLTIKDLPKNQPRKWAFMVLSAWIEDNL